MCVVCGDDEFDAIFTDGSDGSRTLGVGVKGWAGVGTGGVGPDTNAGRGHARESERVGKGGR